MTNPRDLKEAPIEDIGLIDLREWVENLVKQDFSTRKEGQDEMWWVEELTNGVILCRLLEAISPTELKVKYKEKVPTIWGKRDNLNMFLDTLKDKLDFDRNSLFEITDILLQEGDDSGTRPKNVISVLHILALTANERFGIELPGAARIAAEVDKEDDPDENEVDELYQTTLINLPTISPEESEEEEIPEVVPEKAPEPVVVEKPKKKVRRTYRKAEGDEIDAMLAAEFGEGDLIGQGRIVRIKKGQYLLAPEKKVFCMRVIGGKLMVRVGGGWETFKKWSEHVGKLQATNAIHSSPIKTNEYGLGKKGKPTANPSRKPALPPRRGSAPPSAERKGSVPRVAAERRASAAALGDRKTSVGDRKTSLGERKGSTSSLGTRKTSTGTARKTSTTASRK